MKQAHRSHADTVNTVRSRFERQLIRLNMKKKWPTRTGMEDSRPIFFCKRFSYNENALYIAVSPILADPDMNNCAEQMHDSHPSGRIRPLDQPEVVWTVGCSGPDRPESGRQQYLYSS